MTIIAQSLAARIGDERSTLTNDLTTDRQPRSLQLLLLAQMTDLPLADPAANTPLDRTLRQRALLFDYVCWEVGRSATVAVDERAALQARLLELRDAPTSSTAIDGTSDTDGTDGTMAEEDQKAEVKGAHQRP
jgi:hypothetical protein